MSNVDLLEEFNGLQSDVDRWQWIKDHQDTGIIIMLDRDRTYGVLIDEKEDDNCHIFWFDEDIGWTGVGNLLRAYGIRYDYE